MNLNDLHSIFFKQAANSKPGLWANINAKRKRGEAPAKPGSEDYPDAKSWQKVTSEKSAEDSPIKVKRNIKVKPEDEGESTAEGLSAAARNEKIMRKLKNGAYKQASPAWQTSEGKNPEGGLNEKGRKSLKAEGHDIKRPQPEGGARKDSFCARMKGMKSKLTSEETANDPDSRINKSLRKWKCGSDNRFAFAYLTSMERAAFMRKQAGAASAAGVLLGQSISKGMGSLMDYYNQMHPAARSAIIGAGVGGIGNALFGNRRKGFLSRLATGGLAGGAVGGLGRLGYDYVSDLVPGYYNKGEFVGPPSSLKGEVNNSRPPAYTPQDAPPPNTVRKTQLRDYGGRV